MKKTLLGLIVAVMALVPGAVMAQSTSVTDAHIQQINQQFAQNGVPNGFVALDSYGRLELKGNYDDEMQVDRAFSIAQTVVGVKWVSPVTPENIKVKTWEKKLGSLFSRAAVLQPSVRGDAPAGPIRNRYALVVGVGKFKNGINPLQYSVRDATLFYRFLLEQAGFTKNNTYFLADQNATSSNVVKYLNGIRSAAQEDDLVVVYMSSHGTPPDKFGGVYIVTYDTEVNPRERVWYTSVAETALKDFVENLKARRLVMILDTCYSNGAYRAIPGFLPPGGKSLGVGDENEGYGVSTAQGKRLFGAKDIVLEDQPRQAASSGKGIGSSQESYGKVLISASSAGEKSWESDQLHNSVFTYYFVDGMKRYDGSVKDAFDYSKPRTQQRVQQEKGADITQTPQAMATNENWNMRVKR
ncbi:MAG TPA: caspase family protein [Syntrophales bacterium]|nr:caspase family protein [Syntrophales bacterium]